MESEIFKKFKNIYFIGIGGIGISAIARMAFFEGKKVSGSDTTESKVTNELKKLGVKIFIGQKEKNIPKNCDLAVYSVAIPGNNSELLEVKKRGIKILSYPEALGIVSGNKFTIAVSGTHGKTTTTAMISKIFLDNNLEPTVIVGSFLKEFESNFMAGKSQYLVVEADEYKRSFLNLNPKILIITNIDCDHLDYYKDIHDIQNAFIELVKKIPSDGFLICDIFSKNLKLVVESAKCVVLDYSLVENFHFNLKAPGAHNLRNAKAAYLVGGILGVPEEKIEKSLENFTGVWRRFELKGKMKNGAIVYDDYAHNPPKIEAALEGARELFPKNRIIAIFQPHLYSRTKFLFSEFGKAFSLADLIILVPIFPARELFDPTINSEMLKNEIEKNGKKVENLNNFKEIENYIKKNSKKDDVIITIGAGDIYKVGENILKI